MEKRSKIGISAVVTTIAAIVGVWVTIDPWPAIGWVTPSQHDSDIATVNAQYEQAVGDVREFRDEWKCDEYDEELLDLRKDLEQARTDDERAEIEHEIEKLRRKMEELKCSRFEDFG